MTTKNTKLLAMMPDESGDYKNLEKRNKQTYGAIAILSV